MKGRFENDRLLLVASLNYWKNKYEIPNTSNTGCTDKAERLFRSAHVKSHKTRNIYFHENRCRLFIYFVFLWTLKYILL